MLPRRPSSPIVLCRCWLCSGLLIEGEDWNNHILYISNAHKQNTLYYLQDIFSRQTITRHMTCFSTKKSRSCFAIILTTMIFPTCSTEVLYSSTFNISPVNVSSFVAATYIAFLGISELGPLMLRSTPCPIFLFNLCRSQVGAFSWNVQLYLSL